MFSADVRVLAEGEEAVEKYLEAAGVPDFAIPICLEVDQIGPGRWPLGTWVEEASTDARVVTVSFDGIFRVEEGPADEFYEFLGGTDDEE